MKISLPDASIANAFSGARRRKIVALAGCLGFLAFIIGSFLTNPTNFLLAADPAPPLLGERDESTSQPSQSSWAPRSNGPNDGIPAAGWRTRGSDRVGPVEGWRPRPNFGGADFKDRAAPAGLIAPPGPADNAAPNPGWKLRTDRSTSGAAPTSPRRLDFESEDVPRPPLRSVVPIKADGPSDAGPAIRPQSLPEPEPIPSLPNPLPIKSKDPPPSVRGSLLLSAARNAVARGAPAEAVPHFEEFLQLYPDDREARREYAGLLVQIGRVKEAIEQFKSLLAKDPDNASLLVPIADAYLQAKDFRNASLHLTKALENAPDNLEYAVKLARSLAFEGELARAFQVFDRYLGKVRPNDPHVPKTYGALLIDLGRLDDALAFLQPLRERFPDDLETLAYLIRTEARLGNRPKTLELLADLATRKPGTIPVRLELAEALAQAADLDYAGQVYGHVLQTEPGNIVAQLGLARVFIQLSQPREALRILQAARPNAASQRSFLLAWAEFHQLIGEYTQAKQIYRSFLEKNEADHEVRLALAKLYEFVREDEKAKAFYAMIPHEASQRLSARLGLVSTLATQRRFSQAIELAQQIVRETNGNPSARAMLARVMAKSKSYADAETMCREYLHSETRNEAGISEMRLVLGKVYLDEGKTAEAAMEFEAALSRPSGRVAAAFYGLAQARQRVGSPDGGRLLFDAAASALGEPRARLQIADQFAEDYDDRMAGELCQAVLRNDPENLSALIRLIDVRQRQAAKSGHVQEAVELGETIFRQSPHNVRALLAVARSWSIAQKFDKSAATYDRLIASDPEFTVPRRERARVLYSDHRYLAASAAYAELERPPVHEILRTDGQAAHPGAPSYLEPFVGPRASYDILHGEITRTAATTAETDRSAAAQAIYFDNAARSAESMTADLESRAKALKGWRNYAAIPIYKELIAAEPASTEGLFDLGQIYSATLQTHKAVQTYIDLLNVDPQHRDAAIATERANLEMEPQLWMNFDFFGERGRQGLASIDRYKYTTAVRLPYGDENEYFQVGFTRAHYDPVGAAPIDGNIISFRAQKKAAPNLLFYGQGNVESYEPGAFSSRVTFDTGVQYEPTDLMRTFFSGFLENVAESAGSLAQNIYRGGIRFGGDVRPLRCWDFAANYRAAAYSDHNFMNEFNLINDVLLINLPRQLKWVTTLNYEAYTNASVLYGPDPANTALAVHPYFSPKGFSYYETRLEWTHYLSRDYFAHANVCYYSTQIGTGWDNTFNNYAHFRLLFNYDIRPWISVGADSNYTLSQVYRSVSAYAYLILRLPHFER